MGKKGNRYQLVFHYYDESKDPKVFSRKVEDGEKSRFSLTELDVFTTEFPNEEIFNCMMNQTYGGYEDGEFSIDYKSAGKIKSLPLIFSDMELLRKIALSNCGDSVIENDFPEEYFKHFLYRVLDEEVYDFINDEYYMNSDLKKYIDGYRTDSYLGLSVQGDIKKLKEKMHNYKNFRGIEIASMTYKICKGKLNNHVLRKKKN